TGMPPAVAVATETDKIAVKIKGLMRFILKTPFCEKKIRICCKKHNKNTIFESKSHLPDLFLSKTMLFACVFY
ncbi:MAG: hypothetical protein IJ881_07100, partial [Neisseriaceae bacterium]|nr:hypothetical protein [Neisseriaceae bacterium]